MRGMKDLRWMFRLAEFPERRCIGDIHDATWSLNRQQ
jgi:hypothetical protein